MNSSKRYTSYIARVAVLSALAFIIMLVEFPVPMFPAFLKIDFSEIPALLAAFALGPWSALMVELVKNLLHLPMTTTAGIGEIANFFVGASIVVPAGLVYRRIKSRKGAVIGLAAGVVSMAAFASLLNYFALIPLYAAVLHFPVDAIVGMGTQANKSIVSVKSLIVLGILPFNLIKGVGVSLLVLLMYKKLSPILHAVRKQTTF